MKSVNETRCIDCVIKLQERLEFVKKHKCNQETVECNNNLTIAMLWAITQCE